MAKISYDQEKIVINLPKTRQNLINKIFRGDNSADPEHKKLVFALADLRATAESLKSDIVIDDERVQIDHHVAANLDSLTADQLGLPKFIEFTLSTDTSGTFGHDDFLLKYEWLEYGIKQHVERTGCLARTTNGLRRIPGWALDALSIADKGMEKHDLESQWNSLAKFRNALEPMSTFDSETSSDMSQFLKGLTVRVCDSYTIQPDESSNTYDFDVIPFSKSNINTEHIEQFSNKDCELPPNELARFQTKLRNNGDLPAYRTADGNFIVIEPAARAALSAMSKMYKSTPEERKRFLVNPRDCIQKEYERRLIEKGELDGLTDAEQQELIDEEIGSVFIETLEFQDYADRVRGKQVYRPDEATFSSSGTTWLPEIFTQKTREYLQELETSQLEKIRDEVVEAIDTGLDSISNNGVHIPATDEAHKSLQGLISSRFEDVGDEQEKTDDEKPVKSGPIILVTEDNTDKLGYQAKITPRKVVGDKSIPSVVRTNLQEHQLKSFSWQIQCWEKGLAGVLNADEQGLGKTLQTLSFLAWLRQELEHANSSSFGGPILVVAPTSLLRNWEQEVEKHLTEEGLGTVIRLYGSGTGQSKKIGAEGIDTNLGEELLDIDYLKEATSSGRGHSFWILTTYTTLTNFQHSLAKIPFSAGVFDEIQTLKNPKSLRALAAKSMNINFRLGLTGTPIENTTSDIWAIFDQLIPGFLQPQRDFETAFGEPEESNMQNLFDLLFTDNDKTPAPALRRLKEDAAKGLPKKRRYIHPNLMPELQMDRYNDARKIGDSRKNALQKLQHIRSVSVHPNIIGMPNPEDFISASARLSSTFQILDDVKARKERALVFIESIQMQYRFIELLKIRYNFNNVDLINGSTPIIKRQKIVSRFQRHLENMDQFDVLILSPKAAGTGLTLTAANHVIHLSRWWNPAVEEQCNDRTHRIGQNREVSVHIPMAIHETQQGASFDCLLNNLMNRKRYLAKTALWPMGDTSRETDKLFEKLSADYEKSSLGSPIENAVEAMTQQNVKTIYKKLASNTFEEITANKISD